MKKARKHLTTSDKVAIILRHLVERVSVSDLCDQYHLRPTLFYKWQKQFFDNGAAAFERSGEERLGFQGPPDRCAFSSNSSARTRWLSNSWRSTFS